MASPAFGHRRMHAHRCVVVSCAGRVALDQREREESFSGPCQAGLDCDDLAAGDTDIERAVGTPAGNPTLRKS